MCGPRLSVGRLDCWVWVLDWREGRERTSRGRIMGREESIWFFGRCWLQGVGSAMFDEGCWQKSSFRK